MLVMDGNTLATEIRGDAAMRALPVILRTSISELFNVDSVTPCRYLSGHGQVRAGHAGARRESGVGFAIPAPAIVGGVRGQALRCLSGAMLMARDPAPQALNLGGSESLTDQGFEMIRHEGDLLYLRR